MADWNFLGGRQQDVEDPGVFSKIQVLLATSRFEEAEAMIRSELSRDQSDPYLYILLARVLADQRKFQAAREAVGEAIRLGPDEADAYYTLAAICREQGRLKEGLKEIAQAISLDPEDAVNHSLEAGLFLDQSKWEECLKSANRGLEMDADDESCLFYRGMALARLGREDDADKDSLRLLGMDAGDPANHMSRGFVLLESGRTREATEHFTESLRIDPTREDAKSGLILAVIQTRPIAGRLLKVVERLGDLSVWVILIGFVVVGRIRATLEGSENLSIVGNVLDGLIWAFIFLCLSAHMVMELSLRADPLTKNALPERHREGLKWALPMLVIAGAYYVHWLWGGTKGMPIFTLLFGGLALLTRERFESGNSWVRSKMTWLLVVAGLVSAYALFYQYFLITPMALEILQDLRDQEGGPGDQAASDLQDLLQQRKRMVIYPVLGVAMVAAFRDEISEWLEGRAPDGDWE